MPTELPRLLRRSTAPPAAAENRFHELVALLANEALTKQERLRIEVGLVLAAAASSANVHTSLRSKHFRDRRGAWSRRT